MKDISVDFSRSFSRLTIFQPDGSRVETTLVGNKGVLYRARAANGRILVGMDRAGHDLVLGILGALEQEEHAKLYYALEELREEGFADPEVDVDLTGERQMFRITFQDERTVSTSWFGFDQLEDLQVLGSGYSRGK